MLKKVRMIEPGNRSPYRKSLANLLTYNQYLRNPSTGLMTLATIVKSQTDDTLMYSESISELDMDDIRSADIIFFSINTYNAKRGYTLAAELRACSRAILVFGGMHASLNCDEAVKHGDYVLLGDADESILELIEALNENRPIDFPGVAYLSEGKTVHTGVRSQPEHIDTIPDRSLVYDYARMAKRYDTLWPQVHASRGCPHSCAYCAVIEHFGRKIRKRSPENIVDDIEQAIEFHRRRPIPRLNTCVWITDDNFAEDREWAISVLKEIIRRKPACYFSIQARYETGFDDEVLSLMKQAGFIELALGIEFLNDESFRDYHKKSNHMEIIRSIDNIRRHGIGVRGLFIVGTDQDTIGVGDTIADYVIKNHIHGCLIQSMFFTPGTAFYRENEHRLIHHDWNRFDGNVVHYPKQIRPHELQQEIITASRKIYSVRRLVRSLLFDRWIFKVLFVGEFFWHRNIRRELRKEMAYLKGLPKTVQRSEKTESLTAV